MQEPIVSIADTTGGTDPYPRVLLVGPSLSGGGAENRFRLTAQHLFGGNTGVAVLKSEGLRDCPGRDVSIDLGWRGRFSYISMIGRLRRHLQNHSFDAVMAFGFYPNLVAWAAVQGTRSRPALILTEIIALRKQREAMRNTLRGPIYELIRRLILPNSDGYAANSQEAVNDAIDLYAVDPKRAFRIPNIVVPEHLQKCAVDSTPTNTSGNQIIICTSSRLSRQKRIDTLLKAAAGLSKDIPWQLDIVGDGEERNRLQQMAEKSGIGPRVKFYGWLDNPYPIVARADIFVVCSAYEGLSNSLLEAMTLKTPVVVSLHSVDIEDMYRSGAVLCFKVDDHLKLRECLERLSRDKELRIGLADAGFRYVERFSIHRAIAQYEELVLCTLSNQTK